MKLPSSRAAWLFFVVSVILGGLLLYGCTVPNQYPVIHSLDAQPLRVSQSGISRVECIASDPDGDELNHIWSADAGTICSDGSVAEWTAPDVPGSYLIRIRVTDGWGGEATAQLVIDVTENQPPVIEDISLSLPSFAQGDVGDITCIASDPEGGELDYIWSADGGVISGEGETVSWTAPNECGGYNISVTVVDGGGGRASREIGIDVREAG